jgi:hypothetical protein
MRLLESGTVGRRELGAAVKVAFRQSDTMLFDAASERLIEGARVRLPA